jgi:peptide-methionine (S)-S-oxide reductase
MRGWQARLRRAALALAGGAVVAAAPAALLAQDTATATFASGCFWCTEADFEKVPGVVDAVSGYIGGRVANPTYEQVSAGRTGHREAVQVFYDPKRVSYAQLLDVFWRNVDPVDARGQFCDKGEQYTSAIYVAGPEERRQAEASKQALARSGRIKGTIVTAIVDTTTFYKAEEYHQSYYKKNPIRYKFYRNNCGRDGRLKEIAAGK